MKLNSGNRTYFAEFCIRRRQFDYPVCNKLQFKGVGGERKNDTGKPFRTNLIGLLKCLCTESLLSPINSHYYYAGGHTHSTPGQRLVLVKVVHGHLADEAVGNAFKLAGNLLLQLRLHGLDHFVAILLQEQVGRVGCGGYNARGSNARHVISGLVMTSFVTGVDCLIVIPRRYCGYCCLHTQDSVVVEDLGDVHSHFLNRQPQRH